MVAMYNDSSSMPSSIWIFLKSWWGKDAASTTSNPGVVRIAA